MTANRLLLLIISCTNSFEHEALMTLDDLYDAALSEVL